MKTKLLARVAASLLVCVGVFISGCSKDNFPEPAALLKVFGDEQKGYAEETLIFPVVVQVLDETGDSLQGVPVYFEVTNGDGTVEMDSTLSDENGYVQMEWTLGQTGSQTLNVYTLLNSGKTLEMGTVDFSAEIISRDYFIDDRDGEVYRMVEIGGKRWLAENIRHNMPGSFSNPQTDEAIYGRLYNWEMAPRACPRDWDLPTDKEWKDLEIALGMDGNEANDLGWRYSGDVGRKLKSTQGWANGDNGTDDYGFNVVAAGRHGATYHDEDRMAGFWTKTPGNEEETGRSRIFDKSDGVLRTNTFRMDGLSCRCIEKDD